MTEIALLSLILLVLIINVLILVNIYHDLIPEEKRKVVLEPTEIIDKGKGSAYQPSRDIDKKLSGEYDELFD